jgi:hypothetical protein
MGAFLMSGLIPSGYDANEMATENKEGLFSKLGGLLQNPLMAQYLSSMGAGLASGGGKGVAPEVNKVTQQQLQNRNYMKLLQKMLAGDLSDGGKISYDSSGMKLHIPNLNEGGSGEGGLGPSYKADQPISTQQPTSNTNQGSPNPFGSASSFKAEDLAGLTPDLIANALQFGMSKREHEEASALRRAELVQKAKNEAIDQMLKAGNLDMMSNYYAGLLKGQDEEALHKTAVNEREWAKMFLDMDEKQRTELIKNYTYAKSEGYKGSLLDFKTAGGTPNSYDEFVLAKNDPTKPFKGSYLDFIRTVGEARAPRFTPYEQTVQRELGQRESDVQDPRFMHNTITDIKKIDTGFDYPTDDKGNYITDPAKITEVQRRRVLTEMNNRVKQAFVGKTIEVKSDGWYVEGKLVVRNPYAK